MDPSDTIEYLEVCTALEHGEDGPFTARTTKRESQALPVFSSSCLLHIHPSSGTEESLSSEALGRFLQHLFLAFNLAEPGSFNLYLSRYHGEALGDSPPQLSPDLLEFAKLQAADAQWPAIASLPFEAAWTWLQVDLLYDTLLAESPHEKLAFAFLKACEPHLQDADIILFIAQALEAALACGRENIRQTLQQRLALALGPAPALTRWCSRFYDLRSRIAHGDRPILRPGQFFPDNDPRLDAYRAEFFEPLEQALSVLLAVFQDLVRTGARSYHFEETLRRVT